MTDEQRAEKLKEVLSDQAFAVKILELGTAEEVQQALKAKGVELSVEEINALREEILRQAEGGEELDKDCLKAVSGGFLAVAYAACTLFAAASATYRCVDTLNENHGRRW